MKRLYIKPNIDTIKFEIGGELLAAISNVTASTYDRTTDIETNLDVDNENGDDEDILCSKGTRPGLWDDEW